MMRRLRAGDRHTCAPFGPGWRDSAIATDLAASPDRRRTCRASAAPATPTRARTFIHLRSDFRALPWTLRRARRPRSALDPGGSTAARACRLLDGRRARLLVELEGLRPVGQFHGGAGHDRGSVIVEVVELDDDARDRVVVGVSARCSSPTRATRTSSFSSSWCAPSRTARRAGTARSRFRRRADVCRCSRAGLAGTSRLPRRRRCSAGSAPAVPAPSAVTQAASPTVMSTATPAMSSLIRVIDLSSARPARCRPWDANEGAEFAGYLRGCQTDGQRFPNSDLTCDRDL